jgi:hypothetical protein
MEVLAQLGCPQTLGCIKVNFFINEDEGLANPKLR